MFLAHRTDGRAYTCYSVASVVCRLWHYVLWLWLRCILEQKLLSL